MQSWYSRAKLLLSQDTVKTQGTPFPEAPGPRDTHKTLEALAVILYGHWLDSSEWGKV